MKHLIRSLAAPCVKAGLIVALAGCASLPGPLGGRGGGPADADAGERRTPPAVRSRGVYVVVDTDVNELRLMDGSRVVWSAPVGTGTDFRLQDEQNEWEFSTPRGTMYVQYKEELPVWRIPDWYFVEKKLPIPAADHPSRKIPGALGVAAVYLGQDIAIHGTDRPELLGQRVSHGCIRLSNENALRLFHNVQVGTPVVIVGKPRKVIPMPDEPPPMPRGEKKAPEADLLARFSTPELLDRLDRELLDDGSSAWIRTVSRLITRGLKDDAVALRGVLSRAGTISDEARDREYATFLADAFQRGALRATVSLARISDDERERAATAIVNATMDLYPQPLNSSLAPWPTRRVPDWRLGPEGRRGWEALREAEERYRDWYGTGPIALREGTGR